MSRWALTVAAVAVAVAWARDPVPPLGGTHQVKLNGHTFTLPIGFDIELVAGPPLVNRPIVADFDEQGRLYVADSSGSNEPVAVQLKKKPHRVVCLEDTDGDGRFDKSTVFAEHLMFPEGVMWYAGSLYVAGAPSIWKLTDTKGTGVADHREEWFQGKTLTGCANDIHGPYLGPDGWIYWCKGAFAKQTYPRPGRKPFVTRAAHVFRCRPDGSGIEPVMTGGMDNPVEVVFTPGGERIFTCTFLQHPGGGKRDGLIHAVYGGVYGKDHDVIYDHPWTSPTLMPVLTHLGAAAPSGLTRYESDVFGPEYRDNLFAALFNMRKVTRHVLTKSGATFTSHDEDFLVSDNHDFHPTDVLADADGSLLVIDTGGWYKLCCPTSQLHKPDVLGAIYRIRRTGAKRVEDPRGLKLNWAKLSAQELAGLLGDPRPAVQKRAIEAIAHQGAEAVPVLIPVLLGGPTPAARRNAVWAATRIDDSSARDLVRQALADLDETVRQTALHSISVWRDRGAVPKLLAMLHRPSAHNRRAAAEALGRIGDKSAVPALLAALAEPVDHVLQHSLTYALIEIDDRTSTTAGLHSANPLVKRAALVALDQMDDGGLGPDLVAQELNSSNPVLKETASWIAGRHPEWGGALAGYLRDRLTATGLKPAERDELTHQLARFAHTPAVQELLAGRLRDESAPNETRAITLNVMAQAGLKVAPAAWVSALTAVLAGSDSELIGDAVATARALRVPKTKAGPLAAALLHIARDPSASALVRLQALAAVPGGIGTVEPSLFDFLRAHLDPQQPVKVRSAAVDVLAKATFTRDQLVSLATLLKTIGPMELTRLLDAFTQTTDERVGLALIAALKGSPAKSVLSEGLLRPRLAKYGPPVQHAAESLYASLNADAAKQKGTLERLLKTLGTGDVRRGQAVFNSQKAACSSCHAVGYLGGKIGPDLTRIGGIRTERDLLEAIVFPSASFVRSYEPMLVITKDGRSFNGVLKKDAPDEVVLALDATHEAHIARDDIDQMQPGRVSIMPAGLDKQLSPRELADLVAFLKACK